MLSGRGQGDKFDARDWEPTGAALSSLAAANRRSHCLLLPFLARRCLQLLTAVVSLLL